MELIDKEEVFDFKSLIEGLDLTDMHLDKYKSVYYRNLNIAYDSETTQVEDEEGNHFSTQVSHQLCINDKGIILRTQEEFIALIDYLIDNLCKPMVRFDKNKQENMEIPVKIVIYVHNLMYDLTFLLEKLIEYKTDEFVIKHSFSMFEYRYHIQFKDSVSLFGHSLDISVKEFLGNDSPYNKLNSWEYDVVRSPLFELTQTERDYALMDVYALVEVLKKVKENNKCTIATLPVSLSSFVSKRMFSDLLNNSSQRIRKDKNKYTDYYDTIHNCDLNVDLLSMANDAYFGGISFTNPLYINKLVENPGDQDQGSQYPTALCTQLFPQGEMIDDAIKYNTTDLEKRFVTENAVKTFEELDIWASYTDTELLNERGGYLITVKLIGLISDARYPIPNVITYDKIKNGTIEAKGISRVQNGPRIYYADEITVTVNDIDMDIIRSIYTFESYEIIHTIRYRMEPLPASLVKLILSCYSDKTVLKGEFGKEVQYSDAKIVVNTIYGLMGMFPLHDDYDIEGLGEIKTRPLSFEDIIGNLDRHNKKYQRTTFYLWGVYTAAYGHMFLYRAMALVGEDVVFCDTDSVKYNNKEIYLKEFDRLNIDNEAWLRFVGDAWFHFDEEKVEALYFPKTKSGAVKPLGNWESEEYDSEMGALTGAISKRSKCYLMKFEKAGVVSYKFTVAGVGKLSILKYALITTCKTLEEVFEKGLFDKESITKKQLEFVQRELGKFETVEDFFISDPKIPHEFTNKLTKLVNFNQQPHSYVDAQGNEYTMTNKTAVYLNPATFSLNSSDVSEDLLKLLMGEFVIDSEGVESLGF